MMKIKATPFEGLFEIETEMSGDNRGKFTRVFCEQELSVIRDNLHFTQINLSVTSHAGTIRGLHFQAPPAAEAKLIRCLRGRVFDVAVDIRKDSPTFLQWHAVELSDDNDRAVFIPEGFAHGFQSLCDDVQLLYMHTAGWSPAHESGLRHDDPSLDIQWPLPVTSVSDKDLKFALMESGFAGIIL
ncbi:MAG: dTDP-4-dehydrorhamnose 3,5-epimerase [Arenimonas sp.]